MFVLRTTENLGGKKGCLEREGRGSKGGTNRQRDMYLGSGRCHCMDNWLLWGEKKKEKTQD